MRDLNPAEMSSRKVDDQLEASLVNLDYNASHFKRRNKFGSQYSYLTNFLCMYGFHDHDCVG